MNNQNEYTQQEMSNRIESLSKLAGMKDDPASTLNALQELAEAGNREAQELLEKVVKK